LNSNFTEGGATSSRFAALETGVVDATILPVPAVIFAREKGYNELAFLGDVGQFPQNGFGATKKKIGENPDEVYKWSGRHCAGCCSCRMQIIRTKSFKSL
jgi:hypothetical protein